MEEASAKMKEEIEEVASLRGELEEEKAKRKELESGQKQDAEVISGLKATSQESAKRIRELESGLAARDSAKADLESKIKDLEARLEQQQKDFSQMQAKMEAARARPPSPSPPAPKVQPQPLPRWVKPKFQGATDNVFLVKFGKADFDKRKLLSATALSGSGSSSHRQIFFSIDFYCHETQMTPFYPVQASLKVDHSVSYGVKLDEMLFYYFRNHAAAVQLNVSKGLDFETIATCSIPLKQFFSEASPSRPAVSSTAQLIPMASSFPLAAKKRAMQGQAYDEEGEEQEEEEEPIGVLEYSLQMVRPFSIDQISEHYDAQGPEKLIQVDEVTEVSIKVIGCQNLFRKVPAGDFSPFVFYKFYTFQGYCTRVAQDGANPLYDDMQIFPLSASLDAGFRSFLETKSVRFVVFDESDPDEEAYVGCAEIKLKPLLDKGAIKGSFSLRDDRANEKGRINLEIQMNRNSIDRKVKVLVKDGGGGGGGGG